MRVHEACERYFTFPKLSRIRENDWKTNVIALAKIFSYCTLIIPIGVGLAYGVSLLYSKCIQLMRPETSERQKTKEFLSVNRKFIERCCNLAIRAQKKGDSQQANEKIVEAKAYAEDHSETPHNHIQYFINIARAEQTMGLSACGTIQTIQNKMGSFSLSEVDRIILHNNLKELMVS